MTVAELIEELKKFPSDTKVFTRGYEGGYEDCEGCFSEGEFILNVNTAWYYGPHEEADSWYAQKYKDNPVVKGIVL